jgi:hypothetical protein
MASEHPCTDQGIIPEGQSHGSRRDQRISGSTSVAASDAFELKPVFNGQKACSQCGGCTSRTVRKLYQTPTATSSEGTDLQLISALSHQNQSVEFRRPRPSCVGDIDDAITKKRINVKLHDISQSRWIEDPNDHSTEKVYLTIESSDLEQMVTIDTSFCWTQVRPAFTLIMLTTDQSCRTISATDRFRRFRGQQYKAP